MIPDIQASAKHQDPSSPGGVNGGPREHAGSRPLSQNSSAADFIWMGHQLIEKCELIEAREVFNRAWELAQQEGDPKTQVEAVSGILRYAGEALDYPAMNYWERELDHLIVNFKGEVPVMAWFCKGTIASYQGKLLLSQRHYHRFLKALRRNPDPNPDEQDQRLARGLLMLAKVLELRGHFERARWIATEVYARYGEKKLRGVNGIACLLLGNVAVKDRNYDLAKDWYEKTHLSFLSERNWYHYLYSILAFAHLARLKQDFTSASRYLELVERAISTFNFGVLGQAVQRQRALLEGDRVDLVVDITSGTVTTRDSGEIQLGKQYVLLGILEALSNVHPSLVADAHNAAEGLSKSQLIESVWQENYRPEAHDNKLYYNINRLRKLIEPDSHKPKYLLNWKEGYRLAPGLKIRVFGTLSQGGKDENESQKSS